MGERAPSAFSNCLAPASLAGTDVGGFVFGAMGETVLSAFGNCLSFSTVCNTGKGRGACARRIEFHQENNPDHPPNKPYSQAGLDLGLGPGVGITLAPGALRANERTTLLLLPRQFARATHPQSGQGAQGAVRIEDVVPEQSLEYFMSSVHWLTAADPAPGTAP